MQPAGYITRMMEYLPASLDSQKCVCNSVCVLMTTTHKGDNMSSIYIHDNGTCTCATHAGGYLAASITNDPTATIHQTIIGTWEKYDTAEAAAEGVTCNKCDA